MENKLDHSIYIRLAAPFDPSDIEWRAGTTNSEKTRALALAYITSRAVMDRLDEVASPENWCDEYRPGPDGGVICGLSIRISSEWVTKWDGAENTQFEEIKGGLSGAFKRAAVKWGIGRYLYKLPNIWVPCEQRGKSVILKETPQLPAWALPPRNSKAQNPKTDSREQELIKALGFDDSPCTQTRSRSWSAAIVNALLKAKLVENAASAVKLLNQSNLPNDATPEDALAWVVEKNNAK